MSNTEPANRAWLRKQILLDLQQMKRDLDRAEEWWDEGSLEDLLVQLEHLSWQAQATESKALGVIRINRNDE